MREVLNEVWEPLLIKNASSSLSIAEEGALQACRDVAQALNDGVSIEYVLEDWEGSLSFVQGIIVEGKQSMHGVEQFAHDQCIARYNLPERVVLSPHFIEDVLAFFESGMSTIKCILGGK